MLGQPCRRCGYDYAERTDSFRDDFSPGSTHQ
jgi:hypothetical protein